MRQICEGLKRGHDASLYDPNLDSDQIVMINLGLNAGINVLLYAKPEFEWKQMYEIQNGLLNGIDVSQYADPSIPHYEMRRIRKRLEKEMKLTNEANE